MHPPRRLLSGILLAWFVYWGAPTPGLGDEQLGDQKAEVEFEAEDLEFFEKQVRPLLAARCYECHHSQLSEPKGGLRMDSRAAILTGGDTGPAAIAGKPAESLFIDAVHYGDVYQMPPKSRLPAKEVAILERWVTSGLPWPKEAVAVGVHHEAKKFDLEGRKAAHWAWRPPKQPQVPEVKNNAWPHNEIDRFILEKLEAKGLSPASPAEKSVLLRRVYFDLVGLPPSADEVRRFMEDGSADALEKVVDQLLASPHFGERWGRHWMDIVRYAESRGHEFDFTTPNAWQYRDYVIRALNQDVPYDQFVKEHIAGDLLPQPRLNPEQGFNESMLGTGFWFLGEWVHSPVDLRQDESDRHDNMIDVATKAFLGLTVGCARCHDHKFDAISQTDYYALAGYLKSSHYRLTRYETVDHNREIVRQLDELDTRYGPQLIKKLLRSYQPVLESLDKYLLASREILLAVPEKEEQESPLVNDVLGTTKQSRAEATAEQAKAAGLNEEILAAWVEVLLIAKSEPDHPLYAFALTTDAPKVDSAETMAKLLAPARERFLERAQARENALAHARVLVDYRNAGQDVFFPDGISFGLRPVRTGSLLLGDFAKNPIDGFMRMGAAKRAALWGDLTLDPQAEQEPGRTGQWIRAGQTLYTPTFHMESGRLFYLVEGTGQVYATLNTHLVNFGPLYSAFIKPFETQLARGPQWVEHDLSAYAGHTTHLEISATGEQDCSVLMVVEAESQPGSLQPAQRHLAKMVAREMPTPAALAKAYQELLISLSDKLREQALRTDKSQSLEELEDWADLADWMVVQPRLFTSTDSAAYAVYQELGAEYVRQRKALESQIERDSKVAMTMMDGSPLDEHLLIRGNIATPGERVPRRFLTALGGASQALPAEGSGRPELAHQIASPANPLTARVMVNRIWHHLLGRGIVGSVDNFGVLGETPTHPELLDYLTLKFIENGWSIKQLMREIMLSRTYQMASEHTAMADEQDPANLLLHRANLRRLEAEVIRDSLLAVSGRLDRGQFGPSVPLHLTDFLQGRGRPASGPLDGNGRRSIYISIRRNFLSPMMLAFDMPIPFSTVGKRNVSNVPAQALILMNDPLVVEQSRLWAKRILALDVPTPSQRIETMYLEAFARPPHPEEMEAAQQFLKQQAAELKLSEEQAQSDMQLWTDLAHVLFNTKEFIYLH